MLTKSIHVTTPNPGALALTAAANARHAATLNRACPHCGGPSHRMTRDTTTFPVPGDRWGPCQCQSPGVL